MPNATSPTAAEPPQPPRPSSGGMGTMARSIGVGVGGGSIAAIVSTYLDPTKYSAIAAGISAVILGFASGLSEVAVKHRRGMIEAESGEDRRLRAEAERALAQCQREKADLIARLESLEDTCKQLNAKIDAREKVHDDKIALMQKNFDHLNDNYLLVLNMLARQDRGLSDVHANPGG